MNHSKSHLTCLIIFGLSLSACPDPAPPKPTNELDMNISEAGTTIVLDDGVAGEMAGEVAGELAGGMRR